MGQGNINIYYNWLDFLFILIVNFKFMESNSKAYLLQFNLTITYSLFHHTTAVTLKAQNTFKTFKSINQ